ncbi:MAG: protein-glutamate O-methyltransferase CheR [Gallionellaceae bacterium]|nr:MAG: protein-glutamate O-methyltransferase CheR [Gallionellaceae bacterium]
MPTAILNDLEFSQFQKLIYQLAGINLSPAKKALVGGRLAKRLAHYHLDTYGDYFKLLTSSRNADELQVTVDLLTTNETYFFREPKHFDFLRGEVLSAHQPGNNFRAWSAACSSGEEPYSIAMVLADHLGDTPWEVVASDICTRVLDKARSGHYPMERIDGISKEHLSRYCLKGVGTQDNTLLVDKQLRNRVNFMQVNLNQSLPNLGEFDLIFLRNVMIYFDQETKRQIVQRMLPLLKPGGHFLIGHSESLNGVIDTLHPLAPSIYRKP